MKRRRGKKRFRWQERIGDRRGAGRTGLTFIRRISRTHVDRPLAGLPGFIVAALPLALVVGLAWNFPGFWQVPAVVVGGGVLGVLILRMNWSARVKTVVAFAVIAASALASAASGSISHPWCSQSSY
ncbi:MAG TPA: hypothetical protein VLK65_26985 [Vicinamibacteria bacterium]|nr:hypothetical protein [Vicinamibacteria bacterium]